MKKERIGLFLVLAILLSFSALAFSSSSSDWSEPTRDLGNFKHISGSLKSDPYILVQNISFGDGTEKGAYASIPVLYDVNGDSHLDMFIHDQGVVKLYLFNPSFGNFSITSILILPESLELGLNIYATGSWSGEKLKIISSSALNLYIIEVTGAGLLSLDSVTALKNPTAFYFSSTTAKATMKQPKCLGAYGTDWCVIQENNTNIEVFNISNPLAPSSQNYSYSNLTDITGLAKDTNTLATIDAYNFPTAPRIVTACRKGSAEYGLVSLNLSNGAILYNGCAIAGNYPAFGEVVLADTDGDSIFEYIQMFDNMGGSMKILITNPNLAVEKTISSGSNYNKGFVYDGSSSIYWYNQNVLTGTLYRYNVLTASLVGAYSFSDSNPKHYSLLSSSGNKIFFDGSYLDLDINQTRNFTIDSSKQFVTYPFMQGTTEYIIFSKIDGVSIFQESLSYPLVTIQFLNNKTNEGSVFASCSVNIKKSDWPDYVFWGVTDASGRLTLSLAQNGTYNISNSCASDTSLWSGNNLAYYFPNGQQLQYIKYNPLENISNTIDLAFDVIDGVTGDSVRSVISYFLYWTNSTSGQVIPIANSSLDPNQFGKIEIVNVYPGNLTISVYATNYIGQTKNFYSVNDYGDIFYLLPATSFVYTRVPAITYAQGFIQTRTISVTGEETFAQSVDPQFACLNQSVWVNFTAIKTDRENFDVLYTCDGITPNPTYRITESLPAFVGFLAGFVENISNNEYKRVNGLIFCKYATNGTKTITIWGNSRTFPYTILDLPSLVAADVAKQVNITITDTCVNYPTLNLTEYKSVSTEGGFIKKIFNTLGALLGIDEPGEKEMASILIILAFSLIAGYFGVSAGGNGNSFFAPSAITGFLFTIFFWRLHWMTGSLTFIVSIVFIMIGALALNQIFNPANSGG